MLYVYVNLIPDRPGDVYSCDILFILAHYNPIRHNCSVLILCLVRSLRQPGQYWTHSTRSCAISHTDHTLLYKIFEK